MKQTGMWLIIASACGFGLNPMLAQLLYGLGFDFQVVTLYRFLIPALILLPMLRIKRVELSEAGRMFAFGVANALAMLAYFNAIQTIEPAQAIFVYYTYPIFSLLVGWLVWGKRPRRNGVVAGALILLAASMVLSPSQLAAEHYWVLASTFLAPLVVASLIQYLAKPKQSLAVTQRINMSLLGHMLVLLPVAALHGPEQWLPVTWQGGVWLIALAVFASTLPQYLMTLGVAKVGSDRTAIAGSAEMVVAMITGTLVFGHALSQAQITAMLLVVIAMSIRLEDSPAWTRQAKA